MKFLGDVNTDVGGGGGGREYVERGGASLLSIEGPEKRLNARLMAEDFSGLSGLSAFSDFSVGEAGRSRGAGFSAVFISVLVGDRGGGGVGRGSRGGGHACNSNVLARGSCATVVLRKSGIIRSCCRAQVSFGNAKSALGSGKHTRVVLRTGGGNLPSSVGLVNTVVWDGKPADLSSCNLATTGSASSYRASP